MPESYVNLTVKKLPPSSSRHELRTPLTLMIHPLDAAINEIGQNENIGASKLYEADALSKSATRLSKVIDA